jgi:predicted nucleic acid-binding protein
VSTFVDTSAVMAVLVDTDEFHARASEEWGRLMHATDPLLTTNYTLVELLTLAQRRIGTQAVRLLQTTIIPTLDVHWIDETTHGQAVEALLTAQRRDLSLVDCTAFITMRRLGVTTAFTFDDHFAEQGFEVLPAR